MQTILENYLVIILIGLFLIFALIGYLVDLLKNNKIENENNNIPNNITPIEITKIDEKKDENVVENNIENNIDNKDELLENYNEDK